MVEVSDIITVFSVLNKISNNKSRVLILSYMLYTSIFTSCCYLFLVFIPVVVHCFKCISIFLTCGLLLIVTKKFVIKRIFTLFKDIDTCQCDVNPEKLREFRIELLKQTLTINKSSDAEYNIKLNREDTIDIIINTARKYNIPIFQNKSSGIKYSLDKLIATFLISIPISWILYTTNYNPYLVLITLIGLHVTTCSYLSEEITKTKYPILNMLLIYLLPLTPYVNANNFKQNSIIVYKNQMKKILDILDANYDVYIFMMKNGETQNVPKSVKEIKDELKKDKEFNVYSNRKDTQLAKPQTLELMILVYSKYQASLFPFNIIPKSIIFIEKHYYSVPIIKRIERITNKKYYKEELQNILYNYIVKEISLYGDVLISEITKFLL